jgi:type IV pilus assembly protein PilY1
MQFPAYYECDFHRYYPYSKVAKCGEVISEYSSNREYYGYFDNNACYTYNTTEDYWEKANCDCSANGGVGTESCLSGNFLNWLVSSRIDVALKALIGGKADCQGNSCILRPQGARRVVYIPSLNCEITVEPEIYWWGDYTSKDIVITTDNYSRRARCKIGVWERKARVKISVNERRGVLQKIFDKVDLTFMFFNSDNHYGEIKYAFYENDLEKLIKALEDTVPYYGTPTGESLWEVWDYLAQENRHYYEYNYQYLGRRTYKDPYYSPQYNQYIPCRKAFVLLISDGEWNGDVDPAEVAYQLHTKDLREDVPGIQKAQVFTLFTFSTSKKR